MRFTLGEMPQPLLHLLTLFLTTTAVSANPFPTKLQGITFADLFGRGTCAVPCGWEGQLCCSAGQACYTDSNNQAQCTSAANAVVTTAAAGGGSGYWNVYTTTYVETDLVTMTSVVSSWCASATYAAATATATPSCDYTTNESPCGSICCASGQYCVVSGQCAAADNSGSSAYYSSYMSTAVTVAGGSTVGFSAPLRPTSSTLVVLTSTASPTTTEPFVAPVATGANITLTPTNAEHSSGLSGGAIAGIVIGVLLGLALLFLICFYCCLKGLLDGVLALFGLGKKRRRTRETEYVEEYHHHSSGRGGGGRTWYGGGSRPSRVERTDRREKRSGGNWLGIAAGLGGLAAALGLKRKQDRRRDEKYSDVTSSYLGSYYTSESSASSDDRRTRDTRRSSRR